jgi:hypothetical protein
MPVGAILWLIHAIVPILSLEETSSCQVSRAMVVVHVIIFLGLDGMFIFSRVQNSFLG